jgi:hypothetical protein
VLDELGLDRQAALELKLKAACIRRFWHLAGGPHNAVFVAWDPMLPMSLASVQASLRDAVGILGGAFPPVNWRAIFGGPSGTSCVAALRSFIESWPDTKDSRSRRDRLIIARRFQRRVRVHANGTACRRHA